MSIALALLLPGQFVAPTIEDYEMRSEGKVTCGTEPLPENFACAIVLNFDPPAPEGIANISGGEYDTLRGICLIHDGTLYQAAFDPPLTKEKGFPRLRKHSGILTRVYRGYLQLRWPNGKEAKARILRRKAMRGNRPQPA